MISISNAKHMNNARFYTGLNYAVWMRQTTKEFKPNIEMNSRNKTRRDYVYGLRVETTYMDLPDSIQNNSTAVMFADDTKLFVRTDTSKDKDKLQEDLDCVCKCSSLWLLKFHPDKCKVLSLGYKLDANFQHDHKFRRWICKPSQARSHNMWEGYWCPRGR